MPNINHSPVQQESALEQMLRRIKCEFLEMPGLRLTCRQAQRLWNLDAVVCEALLAALVDVRFLAEVDGVFLQRTDAPAAAGLRYADRTT